jgi:molybdopterin-guanine dinucleotide biosynthesis protein A
MTSNNYPTQSAASAHREPDRQVEGLILCGGRGRRVLNADKGLLELAGEPAVSRVLRLLQPHCSRIIISANRNLERYRELAAGPVVPDLRGDYPGPLAGLEAAARVVRSDYLLLMPVDMPDLSREVPARLLRRLREQRDLDLVYARTTGSEHYLCAALRRRCLAAASAQLDAGRHAVRALYASLESASLLFDDELAKGFANRNRLTDWEE